MTVTSLLTQVRLKQKLIYNPETECLPVVSIVKDMLLYVLIEYCIRHLDLRFFICLMKGQN